MNYNKVCNDILQLDDAIRFAGIANLEGKVFSAIFKENVKPLLTIGEAELAIMQSLIRMNTRKTLECKLGKALYSTTVYEKIRRATILLSLSENDKDRTYLMVSFEKDADHEKIIAEKMLPFLKKTNVISYC